MSHGKDSPEVRHELREGATLEVRGSKWVIRARGSSPARRGNMRPLPGNVWNLVLCLSMKLRWYCRAWEELRVSHSFHPLLGWMWTASLAVLRDGHFLSPVWQRFRERHPKDLTRVWVYQTQTPPPPPTPHANLLALISLSAMSRPLSFFSAPS